MKKMKIENATAIRKIGVMPSCLSGVAKMRNSENSINKSTAMVSNLISTYFLKCGRDTKTHPLLSP